ncbi:DUF7220 family protein, partial [Pseudomonas fluorescens]|uniref:DUF7220 family protein n=1 Tax=Pseudomonas fluorescens TaxID=294 RepID=UPI001CA78D30
AGFQRVAEGRVKQAKQTRKASLIETLLNTALGYGVALLAQIVVFPWFGIHVPLSSNIAIGMIFTVVSIARGFVLRRLFEALRVRGVLP